MLNNFRTQLKPVTNLIAKPFMGIHPNILSFFGPILSIPGFYFLTNGDTLLGSLFIIGTLFDMVDGTVARATSKTSKFGGVLDATLDRVVDGALVLCVGVGQLVPWWILVTFLILSFTVSYIKAKAEAVSATTNVGTNKFSVGIAGRGERILIIFVALITNHFFTPENNQVLIYAFVILIVLSLITVLWRGTVIYKALDDFVSDLEV